jgi:hypothetical protein
MCHVRDTSGVDAVLDAQPTELAYVLLADPAMTRNIGEVIMNKHESAELVIKDLGPASKRTKGLPYQTPWIENALPPFNYYCPVC